MMIPVAIARSKKGWQLVHRCRRCGVERRNRVADATNASDDIERIVELIARQGSGQVWPLVSPPGDKLVTRYVALLRGINVGKAKRIAMADLRALLDALGYADVTTILNSGNAVFDAKGATAERIARRIETELPRRLALSAPVIVKERDAVLTTIVENPLAKVADDPSRYIVAFTQDPSILAELKPVTKQRWSPEAFAIGKHAAFLWCTNGILDSKLSAAVGAVLGDRCTARNWATLGKIAALLER